MSETEPHPSEYWPWPWNELLEPPPPVNDAPKRIPLPDGARSRHLAIYGGTGTGKTRLIEGIVTNDVVKRVLDISPRGIGLIDPHGDLFSNSRARLALIAEENPKLEELLFLIDPLENRGFTYDPLQPGPGELYEDRASMLADMVTTIYRDDAHIVNRMRWLLYHAFLTLSAAGLSLKHFMSLMRDRDFREDLVLELDHTELTAYWLDEFPKSDNEAMRWAESSLDRMGPLVTDPRVIRILGGRTNHTFREFLDEGAVVLVNAPIGKLGRGKSHLFCAFILAEFQNAALSRTDLKEKARRPFGLFCDEFQNYTTDSVLQIIKENRKYRLELYLATQEIKGQPKDEALRRSILKAVGSIISFRLDYEDAESLVKQVFTPDIDQAKDIHVRYQKVPGIFGEFTQRFEDPVYRSLNEIWEQETRNLTELPDRILWWKRRGYPGSTRVTTVTVKDLEEMTNFEQIPRALKKQERAAWKLAFKTKGFAGAPILLPKPSDNGRPAVDDEEDTSPFGW